MESAVSGHAAAKRDGVEVEGQVLKGELVQHHRALSTGHGADSGQQLLRVKGLGEVVVRPGVQPRHLVGYRVTLKDTDKEKELLDAMRCRNGNLEISCGIAADGRQRLRKSHNLRW